MYDLTILIQGFPGRSTCHGGLGWSTVAMLRGQGETILVDTGGYGYRVPLMDALAKQNIRREDVTAVALTHCHWDHACNFPLFPNARIIVPRPDLEWAAEQPVGTWELPEFHVDFLSQSDRVERIDDGAEPLPGFFALATPGHTPGHFAYHADVEGGRAIFAGDAVKNETELMSGVADMTLDPALSRESIETVRRMLLDDPSSILVPGHDRLLSLKDGEPIPHSQLEAGIKIWQPNGAGTTTIDLLAGSSH